MTRIIGTCAATGLTILLMLTAQAVAAEPQLDANDNEAVQLKALQEERVAVLTALVSVVVMQYQGGQCDFNAVSSAHNELVAAQLDSTDDPEKRIALLTQQIEVAGGALNLAEERFSSGMTTKADVHRAKSLLLGIRIKLLRERSKLKSRMPGPLE